MCVRGFFRFHSHCEKVGGELFFSPPFLRECVSACVRVRLLLPNFFVSFFLSFLPSSITVVLPRSQRKMSFGLSERKKKKNRACLRKEFFFFFRVFAKTCDRPCQVEEERKERRKNNKHCCRFKSLSLSLSSSALVFLRMS